MSFNGSGTFLINTAGQPVVSGTVISSTAFNALTADLATGLSTAITKDGQTTVTANIPMSTYKFTGLGVGSAATDSANLSQVQSTVTKLLNSVSGADTITATASPTLAAYAAGQMFYFVAAGDNTTSVTLNIDSLGAKAVTRDGSVALAAADIKSGEVIVVVYDGTRFQVVSQLNSAGDARFANVSIASSLYVGGVSTFVGNAGFSANVSIASALSVGGVAAITGATTIGGNLTLSGGTANGVLYLNGSKVATSGSALAFDGTNLTVPAEVYRSSDSSYLRLAGGNPAATGASVLMFGSTHATAAGRLALNTSGTGYMEFSLNSSEAMRLTSTGLGIGTASPAFKLHVSGASSQFALISTTDTTSTTGVLFGDSASNTVGRIEYVHSDNGMRFFTNGTTQATLDSSGNLGLGVVPTNNTLGKTLQVGQAGAWVAESGSNRWWLASNWYYNSGDKYINNGFATLYSQQSGQHQWLTAASGTAGNAISFTQAMTLDASGRLGVGSTSPDQLITINSASTATNSLVSYKQGGTTYGYTGMGSDNRLRLDGVSVDVGVGTAASDKYVWFYTNNTERARLTSGGNLLVGTTTDEGNGMTLTSGSGNYVFWTQVSTTSQKDHYRLGNPNGQVASIYTSGSSGGLYNLSDARAKKNIIDAPPALQSIVNTKIRSFDWIVDDFHQEYGGIAQEFQLTIPEAVITPSDENAMLAIDWAKPIPRLIKAIQEQQAMIDDLKAKVTALESK